MTNGHYLVPPPHNESVLAHGPGSAERRALRAELDRQASQVLDIPCVIGGEYRYTGETVEVTMPCDHQHVLARVHLARPQDTDDAVAAAERARREWAEMPQEHRAGVFLRAAELLAGPWRARINAATMLGQAKTAHQAEIDAACELIDFWRFNAWYAEQIVAEQPPRNAPGTWNRLDYRPLDGFVYAVAPFNFTSIAMNLPSAPALLGNTTLWKPATTSALSCWHLFQLLEKAGLPPGVINLVNGHGPEVSARVLPRPELAGLHFTGSTPTFQALWKGIADHLPRYRAYPRIVGETGGKDFILAHRSADPVALAVAILRGGYEYQGQKCSAASRIYVPRSLWGEVSERVVAGLGEMRQGDVRDFRNFVSAVIDERAYRKHSEYLDIAHETAEVIAGGGGDDSVGWYIEPTLVRVDDPRHRLMSEEIFGPIVTCYVYDDDRWGETLEQVDATGPYALTGAIFADERAAVIEAERALRGAAGNFYINDKPTGAVVGQQPFGGGRASGTNDKAGSAMNLLRWVNPRTIKETFVPPTEWRYPFLDEEHS
jgi:1-pyrroline-5-carboxylate dehydrogenase